MLSVCALTCPDKFWTAVPGILHNVHVFYMACSGMLRPVRLAFEDGVLSKAPVHNPASTCSAARS